MYYSYRPTDRYSSEYRSSRDYYRPTSKDYRSGTEYRSSNSFSRSGSRAYDCCAPPSPPPKDDEYDFLPTYGSYIYEHGSRGHRNDCSCDCCPHTYQGARRVSEGRSYERQPSLASRRTSYNDFESLNDRRYYERESRSKRSEKPKSILVKNRAIGGTFGRKPRKFSLDFDSRSTNSRDVLDTLVDDPTRYKVIVCWDHGVEETLTPGHSWRDVRKYADYLKLVEVKPRKKKHVHWAE